MEYMSRATWASVFNWLNKYFQQLVWWEQHQMEMMTVRCLGTDPHTTRNMNVIETIQQLAARFTTGIYHSTSSVSDILNALKTNSLQLRRARAKTIMLYRIYFGILFLACLSVTWFLAQKTLSFLCPQIEWSGAYCFCPVCLSVCCQLKPSL